MAGRGGSGGASGGNGGSAGASNSTGGAGGQAGSAAGSGGQAGTGVAGSGGSQDGGRDASSAGSGGKGGTDDAAANDVATKAVATKDAVVPDAATKDAAGDRDEASVKGDSPIAPPGWGIHCGAAICDPSTEFCCLGNATPCLPRGSTACPATSVTLECDDRYDCCEEGVCGRQACCANKNETGQVKG